MKQVSEMPTSGQFVAVFQRFGKVESRFYALSDVNPNVVYVMSNNDNNEECWHRDKIPFDFLFSFFQSQKAEFFIAD